MTRRPTRPCLPPRTSPRAARCGCNAGEAGSLASRRGELRASILEGLAGWLAGRWAAGDPVLWCSCLPALSVPYSSTHPLSSLPPSLPPPLPRAPRSWASTPCTSSCAPPAATAPRPRPRRPVCPPRPRAHRHQDWPHRGRDPHPHRLHPPQGWPPRPPPVGAHALLPAGLAGAALRLLSGVGWCSVLVPASLSLGAGAECSHTVT